MQILDPYVWVESIGTSPNNEGPLIVSDLTNYSSPLIRYATGDEGIIEKGFDGVYLKKILGRVHDEISIDGQTYPTHWFQDFFTRVGNVDDFQFVISMDKKLKLNICLNNKAQSSELKNKLESVFSKNSFEVNFVERDQFIRVGQQQKFRYLVDFSKDPSFNLFKQEGAPSLGFDYLSGWNPTECVDRVSYRWMKQKGYLKIGPTNEKKQLEIIFDYPLSVTAFPIIDIMINERHLYSIRVQGGNQTILVHLLEDQIEMTMVIEVSQLYFAPGDSRELGLKVHEINLLS